VRNKTREMLIITMEECGELVHACSKVIRTKGRAKYRRNLRDEIGDVMCMIEILKMSGMVTEEQIQERMKEKEKKLRKWSSIFEEEK
jgi:NTP pyrophosphatase (non-canonical NTP hydrolase)